MLQTYLDELRDLLRDGNGQFYSNASLTRYINGARSQIAKMTGCIRVLVSGGAPYGNQAISGEAVAGGAMSGQQGSLLDGTSVLNTTPNQEMYGFSYINPFVRELYGGVKGIIAVNDIAISWGSWRPALQFIPFSDYQANLRAYQLLYTSNPLAWSVFNDGEAGQFWIFPMGSSLWEMELDVNCVPKPLYTDTDIEALPGPWTDGVKYWAARMAYLSSNRFGMAEIMKEEFREHVLIDRVAVDPGKTENHYWQGDVI